MHHEIVVVFANQQNFMIDNIITQSDALKTSDSLCNIIASS